MNCWGWMKGVLEVHDHKWLHMESFRCSMVGIIVPPFSEREPLFPLMLFFRDETTKISFPIFVDDCSRTLYWWVIK